MPASVTIHSRVDSIPGVSAGPGAPNRVSEADELRSPGKLTELAETDCVAGHVRFELRNVVANYPVERSRRFAGIQPNFGHGDPFAFELRR